MDKQVIAGAYDPFENKRLPSYKTFYDFLKDTGKQLDQDQPFYTFDLADILWKAQLWKDKFPNIFPYYAVKANADPVLVRLFVLLGYGFDCSTQGEIELVLSQNADPKKIIFAHTVKLPKALKFASSVGVDLMTFDSEEELDKIQKYFPSARLVLRLKAKNAQEVYNLSKKFGCEVEEAEKLVLRAKSLNLNVVGVSFHVGGLCADPRTYTAVIDASRTVFDRACEIGYHFTIMDIGAGFFGSTQREAYFVELSKEINLSLQNNFGEKDVEFIAEPGCFCVASAVTLTTAVIGKKCIKGDENGIERHYFLNEGFYGSFFEHIEIYDIIPVPLLDPSELEKRPKFRSKIWGQTCCSEDVILNEYLLPDMFDGELILWLNMGAYSKGVFSNFTMVPTPESKYVFVRNPRLKRESIPNVQEISNFISAKAIRIDQHLI